ncbi:MAG: RluA family pseudouridine synthase [Caldicoprobacterales bacterium]|jgi:23S rRNA pseudouridine1911/1915/1917 synthase
MKVRVKQFDFIIQVEDVGQRLDQYLTGSLSQFSRSQIQSLIKQGFITINGQPGKANYRIKEGEQISVNVPPLRKVELTPEKIDLNVVYQDDDIAVINKPQGMVVHPAAGNHTGTLVHALLYHCDSLSGINGEIRPGIVHRLDKDTSGLLVIAKNDFAHHSLSKQIQNKEVSRIYYAITEGNWKEDVGIISAPIGRSPHDRKKMAVVKGGRQAVTHYRVLERFNTHTYMELTLDTGRTHQIRVHLSYLGHPIIGDPVYGRRIQKFKLRGQALHAAILILTHPRTGERITFRAPVPEYFDNILELLRNKSKNM